MTDSVKTKTKKPFFNQTLILIAPSLKSLFGSYIRKRENLNLSETDFVSFDFISIIDSSIKLSAGFFSVGSMN